MYFKSIEQYVCVRVCVFTATVGLNSSMELNTFENIYRNPIAAAAAAAPVVVVVTA